MDLPRSLALRAGSTRPIRIHFQDETKNKAVLTDVEECAVAFTTAVGETPFWTKDGVINADGGYAEFTPTQVEADAWPVGLHVADVAFLFTDGSDGSDRFHVMIREGIAEVPE